MQRALTDVKSLARDRGLEEAFAMELFGLEHQVQAAVEAHARGLAEHAIDSIRRMAQQLLHTTPKVRPDRPPAAATRPGGRTEDARG